MLGRDVVILPKWSAAAVLPVRYSHRCSPETGLRYEFLADLRSFEMTVQPRQGPDFLPAIAAVHLSRVPADSVLCVHLDSKVITVQGQPIPEATVGDTTGHREFLVRMAGLSNGNRVSREVLNISAGRADRLIWSTFAGRITSITRVTPDL